MKAAKVKLLDQARVRVGACLLVLLMWGCGDIGNLPPTEKLASPRISLGPDELPRDRWLTLNDAIPISPDGAIVKDEADRPYGYVRLGQSAPSFSTTAFGGGQVTQETFRGKWTIVDFWGVWCGDCRVDAPLVEALARDLRDDPELSFLSIHSPPSRERADEAYGQFGSLDAYFAARGEVYPTAIDTDGTLREAFAVSWTPTYLLIGPDLTIRAFRTDLSVGGKRAVRMALDEARAIRQEFETDRP